MAAETAQVRYGDLQAFFEWALEEREVQTNPMANMHRPHVPEEPVDVLTLEDLTALLKACEGPDFTAKRDMAIVRLLFDAGLRLGELSVLTVADVELDTGVVNVLGKGGARARRRSEPARRSLWTAMTG